jgi:hypothetical protein
MGAAMILRLVPLSDAIAAGRWLKHRFVPSRP